MWRLWKQKVLIVPGSAPNGTGGNGVWEFALVKCSSDLYYTFAVWTYNSEARDVVSLADLISYLI